MSPEHSHLGRQVAEVVGISLVTYGDDAIVFGKSTFVAAEGTTGCYFWFSASHMTTSRDNHQSGGFFCLPSFPAPKQMSTGDPLQPETHFLLHLQCKIPLLPLQVETLR